MSHYSPLHSCHVCPTTTSFHSGFRRARSRHQCPHPRASPLAPISCKLAASRSEVTRPSGECGGSCCRRPPSDKTMPTSDEMMSSTPLRGKAAMAAHAQIC